MNKFLSRINAETTQTFVSAFVITSLVFSSVIYAVQVYANSVSLTATVQSSLSFTTSSNQFGNITPGTISWATTTLDVATNSSLGWIVTLSGDNKTTVNNNFQLSGNTASIIDQTEWIAGAATTSAGNAVVRGSLNSSGNVFAFRVMTASSSNGTPFISTSWWGASDADGVAKFAGVPSSTVQRQIGNAGSGSYSSSNHLNTVVYYLNVASTQPTGLYTAPLTYTATSN